VVPKGTYEFQIDRNGKMYVPIAYCKVLGGMRRGLRGGRGGERREKRKKGRKGRKGRKGKEREKKREN
jgi:hypothetical protein